MIRIGEFSKICGLPVKTLRFYDQAGLLPPAFIDPQSGYRYYAESQLLTVKRIRSFKEQGFTLDEIRILLSAISRNEAAEQLKSKQRELLRTIQEAQKQLGEVNRSLQRIQQDSPKTGNRPIRIRQVKPQLAASIRDVVPRSRICLLIDEVLHFVRKESQADAEGSISLLWHDQRGISRKDDPGPRDPVDIEVAIPLSRPITGNGNVQVRRIPGMKAAALLHDCDPTAPVCSALDELVAWIADREGIAIGEGPVRETYLTPDKEIYGRSRPAELLVPVI